MVGCMVSVDIGVLVALSNLSVSIISIVYAFKTAPAVPPSSERQDMNVDSIEVSELVKCSKC